MAMAFTLSSSGMALSSSGVYFEHMGQVQGISFMSFRCLVPKGNIRRPSLAYFT